MPTRPPVHRAPGAWSKQERERERDQRRGGSAQRGYGYDWQKLRRLKLLADPLCESCKERGRATLAEEVHHVIRIAKRPDLRLVWANLESLCGTCHAAKSAAERAADRGGGIQSSRGDEP